MSSSTPASCNFACAFAGCGRRYAHPDAARKHARRHHAEWVAARDLDKLPCHCIVSGDDAMHTPVSRQASANGSDCSIKLLRAAAAGGASPTDELEGRMPISAAHYERAPGATVCKPSALFGKGELRRGGAGAPAAAETWQSLPRTPHAFQLLVAAAIAASDNDSSSGDQSPRDDRIDEAIVIAPEAMCC